MTNEQSGITPSRPPSTYAPTPPETSGDRDPDGASVPDGRGRKKRKRKNERPVQPAEKDQSKESPADGHAVDIVVGRFQIETALQYRLAECTDLTEEGGCGALLGALEHGTTIAFEMAQAPGRSKADSSPAGI